MRRPIFPTAYLAGLLAVFVAADAHGDDAPRRDRHGDPLPDGAVARLGTVRWRQPLRDGSGFARATFSPDGKVLASTGDAGLCLWDVGTGKQMSWAPEGRRVRAAAFTPDGKTLVTQSYETPKPPADPYQIKFLFEHWEVGTGKPVARAEFDLAREHGPSTFAAFSADGTVFVCNERDKKLGLWDARTGRRRLQVPLALEVNHWDPIALSADQRLLAVADRDGHLHLHDPATGKESRRIPWDGDQPFSGYRAPAFSPDGKLLAAFTNNGLRVWDTATGELRREFADCRGPTAFSADGKLLACGDRQGIRLWDTATFTEVRRSEPLTEEVRGLAFSTDGRLLATAQDRTVGVWEVATGKRVNRLPAHEGVVHALAFTPSGTGLVSGADDGAAIVWDLATAAPRYRLPGHHRAAASAAYSPDGKLLATGDGPPFSTSNYEAQVRLWNLADGTLVRQFTGHLHGVNRLAFSPDGRRLASAGFDNRFRVWDPATGKRLYQVRGGEGSRTLAFSPDGQTLVLGALHGELGLYRAADGQKVRDFGTPQGDYRRRVVLAAFAADGKTIVTHEGDFQQREAPKVRVWEAETGREVRSVPIPGSETYYEGSPAARAVSPDGTVAATVSPHTQQPAVLLWDLTTGKRFAELRGHARPIPVLAFSPDGRLLASGSQDTTVLVWDVVGARMRYYWAELLAGTADAKAGETLAADPGRAAAFLKDRLAKSAEVEATVHRLVRELGNDRFAVREKASRELARLAPSAAAVLRRAAEDSHVPEVRQRLQAILNDVKGKDAPAAVLGPEQARMAVALLERMDAPDAHRALEDLARGPADVAATREAGAALERLTKSAKDR